jgi:hypothetical protein
VTAFFVFYILSYAVTGAPVLSVNYI